jgi:hypothetical protein
MYKFISLEPANNKKHKYQITLQEITSGKIHKIKFGAYGYDDFTLTQNHKKKEGYILRHKVSENWTDALKPGTLSRFLLWNKPTLKASLEDYLSRFNILFNIVMF